MSIPEISVIVPVYNTVDYLPRCVNSILTQSYQNFELLLIDDGSSDGSSTLCDDIAKSDSRVKVIHKTNGGLSSARNSGLSNASGKYVSFVDSDDYIGNDYFEIAIDIFNKKDCQVVDFKVEPFKDEITAKIEYDYAENIEIEGVQNVLHDYLYRGLTEFAPFSACRKIYLKSLFTDCKFPEGRINEDIATNFEILSAVNKLIHVNYKGYFYFQGLSSSISRSQLSRKDFNLLYACNRLVELAYGVGDNEIIKLAKCKLGRSYFSLLAKSIRYGFSDDFSRSEKKQIIKELQKKLRSNYFLLLFNPMPLNRKILMTGVVISYRLCKTLGQLVF